MRVNDKQIGGNHYQKNGLQHWDYMVLFSASYLQGVITKYLCRWRDKNGVEDLRKAAHTLDKMIECDCITGCRPATTILIQDLCNTYNVEPALRTVVYAVLTGTRSDLVAARRELAMVIARLEDEEGGATPAYVDQG